MTRTFFFCCCLLLSFDTIARQSYRDSVITIYRSAGRPDFGIDSALHYLTQDAYLWQQKGMPLIKQMKYELGIRYIDSAVKYDTKTYIDYRGFCKCIFQKDYTGALQDFHTARQLIGESVVMDHEYIFYIALCHLQMNRFDSAEYYLQLCETSDAKKLGGDWIHFLHAFYMGITYYEQKQYTAAISYFDRALKEYSHFSDVKYYKSICLALLGKKEEARILMLEAREDLKQGYSINEDNSWYEKYPYQINEHYIRQTLQWLNRKS